MLSLKLCSSAIGLALVGCFGNSNVVHGLALKRASVPFPIGCDEHDKDPAQVAHCRMQVQLQKSQARELRIEKKKAAIGLVVDEFFRIQEKGGFDRYPEEDGSGEVTRPDTVGLNDFFTRFFFEKNESTREYLIEAEMHYQNGNNINELKKKLEKDEDKLETINAATGEKFEPQCLVDICTKVKYARVVLTDDQQDRYNAASANWETISRQLADQYPEIFFRWDDEGKLDIWTVAQTLVSLDKEFIKHRIQVEKAVADIDKFHKHRTDHMREKYKKRSHEATSAYVESFFEQQKYYVPDYSAADSAVDKDGRVIAHLFKNKYHVTDDEKFFCNLAMYSRAFECKKTRDFLQSLDALERDRRNITFVKNRLDLITEMRTAESEDDPAEAIVWDEKALYKRLIEKHGRDAYEHYPFWLNVVADFQERDGLHPSLTSETAFSNTELEGTYHRLLEVVKKANDDLIQTISKLDAEGLLIDRFEKRRPQTREQRIEKKKAVIGRKVNAIFRMQARGVFDWSSIADMRRNNGEVTRPETLHFFSIFRYGRMENNETTREYLVEREMYVQDAHNALFLKLKLKNDIEKLGRPQSLIDIYEKVTRAGIVLPDDQQDQYNALASDWEIVSSQLADRYPEIFEKWAKPLTIEAINHRGDDRAKILTIEETLRILEERIEENPIFEDDFDNQFWRNRTIEKYFKVRE